MGSRGCGRFAPYSVQIVKQVEDKPGITLPELSVRLLRAHRITASCQGLCQHPESPGYTHKKDDYGKRTEPEQCRTTASSMDFRRTPFINRALERPVFIDEASTSTKLIKQTGWAQKRVRPIDYVPFDHWKTRTFIDGSGCHLLTSPWIIDGSVNCQTFNTCIGTHPAPTSGKGDVVIPDNLSSYKSLGAAQILRDIGVWFLFLPPYSSDFNPGHSSLYGMSPGSWPINGTLPVPLENKREAYILNFLKTRLLILRF